MGDFTEPEVMLTMRPNFRAIMPSTTARIRKMGVSMLASSARIQASRSQSRKSPAGGPPALLTRISGSGQAASAAARPDSLVMSPATVRMSAPVSARIAAAVSSSADAVRAVMVTATPSRASAVAQPRPSPLLAAQTKARLPAKPKSMSAVPAPTRSEA